MHIKDVQKLVAPEFQKVDNLILDSLHSQIPLINQIGEHLIQSGGKRMRPLLVLLTAKSFDYSGERHIDLAVIIEFIHTATLLHDDVVDNSNLRRGRKTANAIWGNQASVLVGDFIYSRSFQLMVKLNMMNIMSILADTTNRISEGEVMQLMNRRNPDITEQTYLEVIKAKTAILFAAATKLGAVIANASPTQIQAMENYGLNLGMAFQIVDDALDYCSDPSTLGKNIADDLSDGKLTLPLLTALKKGSPAQQELINKVIVEGNSSELEAIQEAIASTEAIAYTYQIAQQYVTSAINALEVIPSSKYRDALYNLANYAVTRKH